VDCMKLRLLLGMAFLTGACASTADRSLPRQPMGMGQVQIERLTNDRESETHLRVSPNGASLLFNLTTQTSSCFFCSIFGGEELQGTYQQTSLALISLTSGSPGKSIVSQENAIDPTWFSDSRGFAFSMLQGGQAMLARSSVGGETAAIEFVAPTPCVVYDRQPSITQDGRRVIFTTIRPGEGPNIAIMDLRNTTEKCRILFPGESPQAHPDGDRFVFNRVVSGYTQIFVFDETRNLLTQITFGDFHNQQPTWSPDGNRIAFASDRNGDSDIYSIGVDGTNLVQVTQGPTVDQWPAWAPDRSIYFSSNADGQVDIWRAHFSVAN